MADVVTEFAIIRQLRQLSAARMGEPIPLLKCRDIAREADGDLERAFWLADEFVGEGNYFQWHHEGYRERRFQQDEEYEEPDVPFESKIETERHVMKCTCPHCDEEFFTLYHGGATA